MRLLLIVIPVNIFSPIEPDPADGRNDNITDKLFIGRGKGTLWDSGHVEFRVAAHGWKILFVGQHFTADSITALANAIACEQELQEERKQISEQSPLVAIRRH